MKGNQIILIIAEILDLAGDIYKKAGSIRTAPASNGGRSIMANAGPL
jgi:hypothetical protein